MDMSAFRRTGSLFALLVSCSLPVFAEVWDVSADYSRTNNPNGAWSFGRKWSVTGASFDLLTVRWNDGRGGTGWYMGNWGHGGPSIGDWGRPAMWAKNNTNGYPDVRWTSPQAGLYDVTGTFTGADSRGVDNRVYVTVNDSILYSGRVIANLGTAPFSFENLSLNSGDHIDFLIVWNGGVYSEYGWTNLTAKISTATAPVPEPSAYLMVLAGMGLLGLLSKRRNVQSF